MSVGAVFVSPGAKAVGPLSLWQLNNQTLDTAQRLGLPVLAYFLWKGHRGFAIAALGVAGLLWANRLSGMNL